MFALILAAAISAQASTQIDLPAPSSVVIPWLSANRDAIAAQSGCRVIERQGGLARVSLGPRGDAAAWVRETIESRPSAVRYTTTLASVHRKLKSLSMETVVLGRADGGTSVFICVSATLYGLGDWRVQAGMEAALRRCESILHGQFPCPR